MLGPSSLGLSSDLFTLDTGLTDGGKVVSLTRRPPFTPGKLLVLISVRGWVDPGAIFQLESLVNWKI
jgi:hypothetical protein